MSSLPPPPPPPPPPPLPKPSGEPFSDLVDPRDTSAAGSFKVPFTVFDGLMSLLAFFGAQLLIGIVFSVVWVLMAGTDDPPPTMQVVLLSQIAGLVLVLWWLRLRGRLDWRLLGSRRPSGMVALLGLGIAAAGTIGTYAVNALLALLFRPEAPVEQQVLQDAIAGDTTTLVLAILVAVVMAPLVEEVVFRGVLFPALRSRFGMWPAALMSSLIFTLIHVEIVLSQPVALVGLFTLSMWLTWAYHRTGSLLVPIIGHAVFNGVGIALSLLLESFVDEPIVGLLWVTLLT